MKALSHLIAQIGYGHKLARRARRWLLLGDWIHKSARPVVELSDFYPDDKQSQETDERIRHIPALPNKAMVVERDGTTKAIGEYLKPVDETGLADEFSANHQNI